MSRILTPLGKWLRAFRIGNDLLLKDMAEDLEISSAHLSGIETGRKPVPRNFMTLFLATYELDDEAEAEFEAAIDESVEDFRLRKVAPDRRDVAAVLARRFNDLSEEDIEQFRSLLSRSFTE